MSALALFAFLSSTVLFGQTQVGADLVGVADGDLFGVSISIDSDGSHMAIGSRSSFNTGDVRTSGVHVYEYSDNNSDGTLTLNQVGETIFGEASNDHSGSSVSIDSDGSHVAIGAFNNAGNGSQSGHVRVYEYSDNNSDGTSTWNQVGGDIDGEAAGDNSGKSVSIDSDGSHVAIGATGNDGTDSNAGHVRVYEYSGGSWTQVGGDIDGEADGDLFGSSVSIDSDGSHVVIGAPNNDGSGLHNGGHARVYEYSSSSWTQVGGDIDAENAYDMFGTAVSIDSDGSHVAIGGKNNDGNGSNAGHVRVYEYSSSSWTQVGVDIDGSAVNEEFGTCGHWGNRVQY